MSYRDLHLMSPCAQILSNFEQHISKWKLKGGWGLKWDEREGVNLLLNWKGGGAVDFRSQSIPSKMGKNFSNEMKKKL